MIHLREISIEHVKNENAVFPFNIPAITNLGRLTFNTPVTIFVGENGTGKSTLIEGIALAAQSIAIGSEEIGRDTTLTSLQPLVDCLKLVWNKRTRRGFFLRAEDVFGYIKRIHQIRQSMLEETARIDREYEGRSEYAKNLAKMPASSSLQGLESRYGEDAEAYSHGEFFLTLFQSRFVPGGLYLLDEPEAALSPLRQLSLISLIKEMILQDAQFIIATHSPILMAFPDASLMDFDKSPPAATDYDQLEHVILYRSFLSDPQAFIKEL